MKEKLVSKQKDYQRFSITLMIMSSYFFFGAIDTIFVNPTSDGDVLLYFSLLFVVVGYYFHYHAMKLKQLY